MFDQTRTNEERILTQLLFLTQPVEISRRVDVYDLPYSGDVRPSPRSCSQPRPAAFLDLLVRLQSIYTLSSTPLGLLATRRRARA